MTINRYDKSNFPLGKRGWDQYVAEHHAERFAEAQTMTRAELELRVADLSKIWLELLGYIDSLERGGAMINKDRQEFFKQALDSNREVERRVASHARRAKERWKETREKKTLMKQAWLLMRDQYRQSNNKPDKIGFASDMFECFGLPQDVKSIYPWIKKWESE